MTSKAVGLIETIGLTAAIEAADAATKSARVTLLGYENSRGGGLITVKFVGDVGAVKAAIAAGTAAAQRVGKVASCLVIPRPHQEIEALISQIDRGRAAQPAVAAPEPALPPEVEKSKPGPPRRPRAGPRPEPAAALVMPEPPQTEPAAPAAPAEISPAPPAVLDQPPDGGQ